MRFSGGHDILLKGEPERGLTGTREAAILNIPLSSRRFTFSEVCVEDGAQVKQGDVLARDPGNFGIPLLAPRSGTVKLDPGMTEIVLEGTSVSGGPVSDAGSDVREKLARLGAWQYFSDAQTYRLPDPAGAPAAVIVSSVRLEPFTAATEVLLEEKVPNFVRGLEHLHGMLGDDIPIYLVVPSDEFDIPDLKAKIFSLPYEGTALRALTGQVAARCPWVRCVPVPLRYPFGKPKVAAQKLDLESELVWATDVEGVLAVDQALSRSEAVVGRTISVGGPAAKNPTHVEAPVGYPMKFILSAAGVEGEEVRVINGGALTGDALDEKQVGLDTECNGITVIPECTKREFLAWANPGFTKHAFMNAFASLIYPFFRESYTTGLRGERRPCISCAACEFVCPARLMPYLIYRYVDNGRIDDAVKIGLQRCVNCGLCTQVCTSKLEHRKTFVGAQQALLDEAAEAQS
jgi:Na+-transporting NADH:ubiquinone oxidoreductase subunit NqrA